MVEPSFEEIQHLAREGNKVMQFLSRGRYIAVVVDGEVQFYGKTDLG